MDVSEAIDDQTIHLAIAFDKNYLQPFYALACSIGKNNTGAFHIHAITTGISNETRNAIVIYLRKYSGEITFYDIDVAGAEQFVLMNNWTSAVYYRLYFPQIVPTAIRRLLYLDTDMLVINGLQELYNIDLEGYPIAAVYDNYVKTQPLIGIYEEEQYFNSGMMVIDTDRWRSQSISERTMEYLRQYPERIKFVDQCGLNAILKNNWKKLPGKYNLLFSLIPEGLSKRAIQVFLRDKVVVHFTLQRPWNMLCKNRLRYLYFYYLRQSPGRYLNKYTDFSINKIPAWIKIRLVEFYFDHTAIQKIWRKFHMR
ncbi:glycosyltransferase family 8 protein [Ohtaekwangia sp.]|uniref:glycosyltransferase family 8 protein n=1 Tax=Ohtaekwangia sp. TaxID=2066019 RepID=UPI002F9299A8